MNKSISLNEWLQMAQEAESYRHECMSRAYVEMEGVAFWTWDEYWSLHTDIHTSVTEKEKAYLSLVNSVTGEPSRELIELASAYDNNRKDACWDKFIKAGGSRHLLYFMRQKGGYLL